VPFPGGLTTQVTRRCPDTIGPETAQAVGFHRCQSLVVQQDRHLEGFLEHGCLGRGRLGRRTRVARKREREPDDNEAGVKLRNNSGDRPVVRIDVSAAHNDRMRAREHPSRVAHRNADAAFPEVDANYPSPGNPETGCLLLAVTGVQSDPWPLEPGSLGSRPNASSSLAMASSIPARFFPPAVASSGVPPPPPPTAAAAA